MRFRITFLLLFSLFSSALYAADVKGSIIDAALNEPFSYVNVAVLHKNGQDIVAGAITDINGAFVIPHVPNGDFLLRVSFVGYNTVELPISISNNKNLSLKPIVLPENAQQLATVEVEAQRTQMKLDVDKRVFEVGQNIAATGGSVSQLLETIPSVEVDTEGNISLRNNENVTVWINGRPSGLSEENRGQILEQMAAENIESIEVITNPSAKFSPEGSAGIINLILKKDRKAGYFGSVSAGGNTLGGYEGSANFNMNNSKIDAYLSVGTRTMRFKNESVTDRITWLGENPEEKTHLIQENSGKSKGNGTFLRGGITYNITEKDQLGLSLFGMLGHRGNESRLLSTENDLLIRDRNTQSKSPDRLGEIAVDYYHSFRKGSDLRASISFNAMNRNSTNWFNQQNFNAAGDTILHQLQEQINLSQNRSWEMQVDYTNQFSDQWKLETGYKGNINSRKSDIETNEGHSAETMLPNIELANQFDYNENIQALYATVSGKFNALSAQVGLRGEYMRFDTETISTQNIAPYTKEYFQLFPSVFISYALPDRHELQLNYTRRVNRPRGRRLNSFRNITDSTSISYGNPSLEPEFTDAVELNYLKSWDNHTLSASAYYRTTNGVIQQVRYYDAPTMFSTYENISRTQNAGLELVGKNRLFKMLDLTTTINLYYYKLGAFNYQHPVTFESTYYPAAEDFSWDARLVASVALPYSWTIQATGRYRSGQVVAQGERSGNYSLDIGIRKTFLNRKLTIALTGRDLLDSHRRKNTTWGDNFYQLAESHAFRRSIGINITFNFGSNSGKKKIPSENDSMMMDDMEGFDF